MEVQILSLALDAVCNWQTVSLSRKRRPSGRRFFKRTTDFTYDTDVIYQVSAVAEYRNPIRVISEIRGLPSSVTRPWFAFAAVVFGWGQKNTPLARQSERGFAFLRGTEARDRPRPQPKLPGGSNIAVPPILNF